MSNILLFCMSIRGGDIENYYLGTENDALFCGISQLEPGTKQLLFDFAKKGQILDRIIVLNTNKTVESRANIPSGYEYYISRIKDFIIGHEECFKNDFANLSLYDRQNADRMIGERSDELISSKESSLSVNRIAKEIIRQVKESENQTDVALDISEEDKDTLLEILEDNNENVKYDTDKYQKLRDKYFYTGSTGKTSVIDALRYRESMYASLRLKYEKQLLEDSKTRHLVILLYKEIERLQKEIEKLTKNRERVLKQYVSVQIMKLVYDEELRHVYDVMGDYRRLIEERFESVDVYLDNLFKSEVITEDKMSKAAGYIPKVLSLIMQEASEDAGTDNSCHIYIDTQGGLRTTSNVMNGTLELLKNRREIVIENSLGINYDFSNIVNSIEDVSVSQTIFKLVAAMNEFTKTARADSFREYYDSYNKSQGRTAKSGNKEEEIVDIIQAISDSISLCDVNLFEENIGRFTQAIVDYKNNPAETDDEIFKYFVDDIEKAYAKVLNNRSVIDEVEWCLDMKLYQQALTLIESKMPGEFVKNKVVFYSSHDVSEIEKIRTVKDRHVRRDNFVFDNFLNGKNSNNAFCFTRFCDGENGEYNALSAVEKKQYSDKNDYCALRLLERISNNSIDCIVSDFDVDSTVLKFEQSKKNSSGNWVKFNSYIQVFSNISGTDNKKKAGRLLRLHKALKRCRNMTNHASDYVHPKTEHIVNGIKIYIKLARELCCSQAITVRPDPVNTQTHYGGPQ